LRTLLAAVLLVLASAPAARAEDDLLDDDAPAPIEIGAYTGTFISNYYHQFYQLDKVPGGPGDPDYRPELRRFSPLAGIRFAYFFLPWLGGEADLNVVMAATKAQPMKEAATIYSGRLQVMFQAPNLSPYVVPYVSIGDGFAHLSSEYLGSDTDYPPFLGAGARIFVHRSLTLRVDGRWMRAPTPQAPYTLNCNLGELMVGLSFRPSRAPAEPPPPPPPPPVDSDADGIFDDQDRCPNEPEDADLYDDTDGCPDPDNDSDGIADAKDKCPLEPEDKDGFQDDDGCPDADNDSDSVPDAQDKCPLEPEDVDGFDDLDGCPELDNDSDGIGDADDKCPNEAEVINGNEDEDGCPDRGNALVVISPDRLELLEAFEWRKGKLVKSSFNLLRQIGANLRAHPEILRLRITVHVQPTRNAEADQKLSDERSIAIRDWLLGYGIDSKRLEPRGFGGRIPLVDPKTRGAKAINERVDLIILERK
jgi:outer membrane protein OmpA-like peptidoglycan-associated protein